MDINRIKAVGFGVTYPMGNFKELSFTRRPLTSTDILIDVLYAGICHSDIHMARGEWGKWHENADFRLLSRRDSNFGKVGTTQIGNATPRYELKLATPGLYSPRIAKPGDVGSRLGIYLEEHANPLYTGERRYMWKKMVANLTI